MKNLPYCIIDNTITIIWKNLTTYFNTFFNMPKISAISLFS